MTTRTFWLSFCDPKKPEGSQFLGVTVIDVTEDDAVVQRWPGRKNANWAGAALAKAWREQANPGGEVAFADITDRPQAAALPRNRLMQKDELIALGAMTPEH